MKCMFRLRGMVIEPDFDMPVRTYSTLGRSRWSFSMLLQASTRRGVWMPHASRESPFGGGKAVEGCGGVHCTNVWEAPVE